jgi:hypothetical protein
VSLSHKFAKRSRDGIFRNERTRSIPLDPKLMFWGVSNRFVTPRKSMQNWPNWCHYRTNSLKKVASEFYATNAPDPLHLTQNTSFGVFRTVSFLPESRCKTGHYRTSLLNKVASEFLTTNAPDPLHWTQNSCFGPFRPFRYCTKVDAKLAELAPLTHKFAKHSRVGLFRNERTRSTPLDPKLMFWGLSDRFVTAESRCKTGRTGAIITQVR